MVATGLVTALENLDNISSRLDSRIQKEQAAGQDMTDAVSALTTADAKIALASTTIASLEAYLPDASTTLTASTTVNLDGARDLASTAQSSIKDAQKALNDVVSAIAQELGLKVDADEHVEATSTASVTSQ